MPFEILENGEAKYSLNTPAGKSYFSPEQRQWNKKVNFESVVLLDSIQDNHGVAELTPTLYHVILEVDAEKFVDSNECVMCGRNGKYHYFRNMGSGVFHICWKCAANRGTSSSGPLTLFKDDRKTPM